MKPDDKLPAEMLDDIREYAVKARDAADALYGSIKKLNNAYPTLLNYQQLGWIALAFTAKREASTIADETEELIASKKGETDK